jgi:ABC-2 type transport system permease protein
MTLKIAWTELKLLVREPLTMIVSLLFPLLLMLLLAGAFGSDPDPDMAGVSGVDFYVPVYAAATVAVLGFMGLPTHLAAYRERRVLLRSCVRRRSSWPWWY